MSLSGNEPKSLFFSFILLEMKNNNSFNRTFYHHKDRIYNFVIHMLNDKETAKDITQEVFVKLFEVQQNGQHIEKIGNWLFVTARNLCLNAIRDGKKSPTAHHVDIEHSVSNNSNHRIQMANRAIATLDTTMREALILKSFEDFSYQQISEVLGVTVPAVRSLLYKARLQIRELVNKKP